MAGESANSRKMLLILNILLLIVFLVLAGVLMFALFSSNKAAPVVLQANVYIASDANAENSHKGRGGKPSGYFHVKSVEGDRVTVSGDAQMGVDSVIAGGISEAAPQGFLRRVTGVEKSGPDTVLTTVPAALDEAIKECDVTAQYVLKPDGNYVPLQHKGVTASGWGFLATPAFADDRLKNLLDLKNEEQTLELSAGVKIEISLKIDKSGTHFRLVNHLQGKLTAEFINFKASENLFQSEQTRTLMVGPVPVVWTNQFKIDLDGEAKIEGSLKPAAVTVDKKIGFRYDSGKGLSQINEDHSSARLIELVDSQRVLDFGCSTELKFGDTFTLYDVAGPSLNLSLKLELNGGLQQAAPGAKESSTVKFGGKQYQGFVHYKVSVPISGEFILQIPDFNPFSAEDSIELINQPLFDTGDALTLIDWQEPELPKDFMKNFDLSDIRLPYDNNYATTNVFDRIDDNPACLSALAISDDPTPDFKPMAKAPDECWKAVKDGISTERWSNEYVADMPYIEAEISSPTYADFNGDGFIDVAFYGTQHIPTISQRSALYVLIANIQHPEQPFIGDFTNAMQGWGTYWTFYEGGLFTSEEVDGPDEPIVTNFRFVTKSNSITAELAQTRGTKKIAYFD